MAIPAEREELENLEKTFAGNLDALRAVDSDLADRLAACDLPDDLEHTDTFDGQQSFRSASLSRSGWFGQTSMPSLRDQIVIDRFDHAGSNVILPGCGQGTGIKLLLDRLAQHNTVYVYEPTPLNLALLLRLHDLAHAIRIHRLVLLCDETLDKPLLDVLARYPLLTAPAKMLSWPWLTDEQTQKLSSQVGKTLDTIASDVKDRLDHAKKRLADMPIEPPPTDGPARVFICSLTAKPAADQFAKDLAAGFEQLGHRPATFLLDRPEQSSFLAISDAVVDSNPHLIVSVAATYADLPIKPPPAVPFATVLALPGERIVPAAVAKLTVADHEHIITATEQDTTDLADRVPERQREHLDLPVNGDTFCPLEPPPAYRCDVLLFADVTDLDSESAGVRHHSHKQLWKHLISRITNAPLAYRHTDAEAILQRACRETQIDFGDDDLFQGFLALVTQHLGPAASAVAVAGQLIKADLRVTILGSGWDKHGDFADAAQRVPADPAELNRMLNAADIVLCLDPQSNWRTTVLNALCAAKPVAVQKLANDKLDRIEPLRDAVVVLQPQQPLAEQLRDARERLDNLAAAARRARAYLLEHHSFVKHAQAVLDASLMEFSHGDHQAWANGH